jgi:hypothetical protein
MVEFFNNMLRVLISVWYRNPEKIDETGKTGKGNASEETEI